ncbi:putative MFS transporter [Pseudomonas aeruginosa]|nr:putative MFS transporter [Pseudomonas aeruginosa]BAP48758.1 putative MFS transporter [Pseudomonas aeruginosa]
MTNPTTSIEDVPLNAFHRLLTLRSGGGSFVDGYVLSIIGVAMLQMTAALQLSSFWQGMIAASALVGIFFGGFLGGWLTDRLGRRRLFFVGPSLFVLASLAQYGVDSAAALFVLRFLIGVAVGIEYPVATALLVEFLPKKYRGPRLATLTILWFAGAAFAYLVGDLILRSGGEDAWRLVLASTAAIGAVLFLLRIGPPRVAALAAEQGPRRGRRTGHPPGLRRSLLAGEPARTGAGTEGHHLAPALRRLRQAHALRHPVLDLLGDPRVRRLRLRAQGAAGAEPEGRLGLLRFGGDHPAVRHRLHHRHPPDQPHRPALHAAAQLPLVRPGAARAGRLPRRLGGDHPRPVRCLRAVHRRRPGAATGLPERTVPHRDPRLRGRRRHLVIARRRRGGHLPGAAFPGNPGYRPDHVRRRAGDPARAARDLGPGAGNPFAEPAAGGFAHLNHPPRQRPPGAPRPSIPQEETP